MKRPDINNVEVDMVPLIDIISLLLMFLIIVGDTTASSNIASLRLPTADQAKTEKEWGDINCPTKGRIVVQIKPEYDTEEDQKAKNGKYSVVFNAAKHGNDDEGKSLKDHLSRYIDDQLAHGNATKRADGTLDIPVKIRIPAMCPMQEVEKVLFTIASVQLTDIQYAAAERKK